MSAETITLAVLVVAGVFVALALLWSWLLFGRALILLSVMMLLWPAFGHFAGLPTALQALLALIPLGFGILGYKQMLYNSDPSTAMGLLTLRASPILWVMIAGILTAMVKASIDDPDSASAVASNLRWAVDALLVGFLTFVAGRALLARRARLAYAERARDS